MTDDLTSAIGGLMGVAVVADVASKVIRPRPMKPIRPMTSHKPTIRSRPIKLVK